MSKSKIYISGRITGYAYYKQHFQRVEDQLTEEGWAVTNPAKNHGCESYKEWIDIGLFQLMQCKAIYMLKGWENSRGAKLEHDYAQAAGLLVLYEM